MIRTALCALLLLFTVTHSAFAAELPMNPERAKLPAGLSCVAADPTAHERADGTMLITRLNTENPEWNVDGSFDSLDMNLAVSFNFNNGCDNNYTFLFLTDDLLALAQGKVTEVRGLLNYFNAFMPEREEGNLEAVTTTLTCKKS